VASRLIERESVVERIWSRDATLWTGRDEAKWLGWLDEPKRMLERVGELEAFSADTAGFAHVLLLGMGGSSLAPEVLGRTFGGDRLHVLDTSSTSRARSSSSPRSRGRRSRRAATSTSSGIASAAARPLLRSPIRAPSSRR
jgi:hypothetical protein